jgi:hypothetical protein
MGSTDDELLTAFDFSTLTVTVILMELFWTRRAGQTAMATHFQISRQ